MLADWERRFPGRVEKIARAMGDIRPSQLADASLFDFASLGHREDSASADAASWLRSREESD